ncbi:hypothetical protein BpHYR1_040288 [Brachionus plicatilis]|uniref:Uncharacterized protein n=1 Tax=Brachionus plicatilis TaxID=10195 RepID=A0A3M7R7Z7_BRAPC|nr:hypothetical protein BpHYR1_040288 [Brachionus plicatilis]
MNTLTVYVSILSKFALFNRIIGDFTIINRLINKIIFISFLFTNWHPAAFFFHYHRQKSNPDILELILSYENYRKGDIYLFQLDQINFQRNKIVTN